MTIGIIYQRHADFRPRLQAARQVSFFPMFTCLDFLRSLKPRAEARGISITQKNFAFHRTPNSRLTYHRMSLSFRWVEESERDRVGEIRALCYGRSRKEIPDAIDHIR